MLRRLILDTELDVIGVDVVIAAALWALDFDTDEGCDGSSWLMTVPTGLSGGVEFVSGVAALMLLCESAGCTSATDTGGVCDLGADWLDCVMSRDDPLSIVSPSTSSPSIALDWLFSGSGVGVLDFVGSNGSYASGELGGEFGGSGGVLGPLCITSFRRFSNSSCGSISSSGSSGSCSGLLMERSCVCFALKLNLTCKNTHFIETLLWKYSSMKIYFPQSSQILPNKLSTFFMK